MAKNKRNRDPLPDDFGSWEAAAEFWDTHDLTDYEDTERDVPDVQINLVASESLILYLSVNHFKEPNDDKQ